MTTTTAKPEANLGQLVMIASGIFVLMVLAVFNLTGGTQMWTSFWSILTIPLVLFLGNAANQKLNLVLFKRELPVGFVHVLALVWLVAAR